MAVVKSVTAADIYKTKLSGSARSNDTLSTPVDKENIKSTGEMLTESTATKPSVKTKAQYQADTLAKMTAQEEVPAAKKKAKKKIKLSKVEKKNKAKKERREAFDSAKPKHQARKNKSKGKPKRVKQTELDSEKTQDKKPSSNIYKKIVKRTAKNKDTE